MTFTYLLKSSIKIGAVGGSLYYTIDKGYWGNAEQSIHAHEELKKQIQKIPFHIKYIEIPYLEKIPLEKIRNKETFVEYWNWGVRSFFCSLNCLPRVVAKYSGIGWEKLVEAIK